MGFETFAPMIFLTLVPLGVWFCHVRRDRGTFVSFPFRVWNGSGFLPEQKFYRFASFVSAFSFWASVVLVVLSMAGPYRSYTEKVFLSRGIDIVIVLDESPSMAATDFPPHNRFEAAKAMIRSFVEKRENDAIGLVSFGKEAAIRVPPTLDYENFLSTLDELSIMDLGDGTAIGMGLAVACLHLRDSTAKEKVIVLLTDGANNSGEIMPETAAKVAKELGIRLYTIGIGSEGDIPIDFTNPETGVKYSGSLTGGFDEELLRNLALASHGSYFQAMYSMSLDGIVQSIDSLESQEKRFRVQVTKIPLYPAFLAAAILLLCLDLLVRTLVLREVL